MLRCARSSSNVWLALRDRRCLWHLSQNIAKKLKKPMGEVALKELMRYFQAAAYATTEAEMRAKWELVMKVLIVHVHDSCSQCRRRCVYSVSSCYMQSAEASDAARGVQSSSGTSVSAVKYMSHILLDERRWAF